MYVYDASSYKEHMFYWCVLLYRLPYAKVTNKRFLCVNVMLVDDVDDTNDGPMRSVQLHSKLHIVTAL